MNPKKESATEGVPSIKQVLPAEIKTTGSTGGLHSPYKGLIQA